MSDAREPAVSVVLTTYAGDDAGALRACLDSVCRQERSPEELVVVRDHGLPSALVEVVADAAETAPYPVRDVRVDDRGRGHARAVAVREATSELVAVIDADDVACPDRLARQVAFLGANPEVDAVGGYVGEFETTPDEVKAVRRVPTDPVAVRRMAYYRCPLNHPTVTFRRQAVLGVGNYRQMEYGEDYELWCRLLADGGTLTNLPKVLVNARADGLMGRRGGLDIAWREVRLQRAIVDTGFYGWPVALANLLVRVPLRLLPERLLGRVYRHVFRA
ncbi:glycosyltransferase [Salinigranum salinum]|uniref:glycosyltransferase n=1 Tax=Salinigranum salinum TaxID=1364937 RepID=UPI001260B4F0|nr:glycosyltransferase [Salinigranum salinum]